MRAAVAALVVSLACCGGIAVLPSSTDSGTQTGSSSGAMGGSSSSGGTSSGGSSGSVSSSSSSGGSGSSSGGIDDAGPGLDAVGPGPDCGGIPSLHENPAGSIYCQGPGPSGITCTTGTQCCVSGNGTIDDVCSSWTTGAIGCMNPSGNSVGMSCNQISDCVANGWRGPLACCLQGGQVMLMPGCGYPRASGGTAIACEGIGDGGVMAVPCAAGETNVCSTQADCPMGTTCTAGKWGDFQFGFCL